MPTPPDTPITRLIEQLTWTDVLWIVSTLDLFDDPREHGTAACRNALHTLARSHEPLVRSMIQRLQ
jgi:hypothetical protein